MFIMAELGYTHIQVYDLTLHEVLCLRNAIMLRNSRQWEMSRYVAYSITANNPYRKGSLPAIHNFLPLLSDMERFEEDVSYRKEKHKLMSSLVSQYSNRWKN